MRKSVNGVLCRLGIALLACTLMSSAVAWAQKEQGVQVVPYSSKLQPMVANIGNITKEAAGVAFSKLNMEKEIIPAKTDWEQKLQEKGPNAADTIAAEANWRRIKMKGYGELKNKLEVALPRVRSSVLDNQTQVKKFYLRGKSLGFLIRDYFAGRQNDATRSVYLMAASKIAYEKLKTLYHEVCLGEITMTQDELERALTNLRSGITGEASQQKANMSLEEALDQMNVGAGTPDLPPAAGDDDDD